MSSRDSIRRPYISARLVCGVREVAYYSAFACHCPLSEEEWDDLADDAGDALQDRHDADERGARRVREDEPA